MKINDNYILLSPGECSLLNSHASKPFNLGGYTSLDDIVTKLNVSVSIELGKPARTIPPFLGRAFQFWMNMRKLIGKEMNNSSSQNKKEALRKELMKVERILEHIQGNIGSWSSMQLRGLYNPEENAIELYPDEMRWESGGAPIDELLISTFAHETMHAYFNRPGHKFASEPTVEEPLAEFGMLLYLYGTLSAYYNWAYHDVKSKMTCYKYGADIMDQYRTEPSPSPTRQLLEAYKFKLGDYPIIMDIAKSIVLCKPKGKGLGVDETPIGKVKTSGKLSLPAAPPPYHSSSTVLPKRIIVVRERYLCQFVKEVFVYLEGNGLLGNLDPYISTRQAAHLRTITNGIDFNLTGILYVTSMLPVDTDYSRMFDRFPFVINGVTYYLSREWYGNGNHSLSFDEFVKMIKSVYPGQFDIEKVGGDYIMYI